MDSWRNSLRAMPPPPPRRDPARRGGRNRANPSSLALVCAPAGRDAMRCGGVSRTRKACICIHAWPVFVQVRRCRLRDGSIAVVAFFAAVGLDLSRAYGGHRSLAPCFLGEPHLRCMLSNSRSTISSFMACRRYSTAIVSVGAAVVALPKR